MTPIFYGTGPTTGNGIGRLNEALGCVVYEELNGGYYLELQYPADGEFAPDLQSGGALGVICPSWTVGNSGGAEVIVNGFYTELFDIYSTELTIDGVLKVLANHRSRVLSGRVYAGTNIYGSVAAMVSDTCPTTTIEQHGVYNGSQSFAVTDTPKSLLSCIIGGEESMATEWNYEFAFSTRPLDNTKELSVWQFTRRGDNRGAVIRYGYNLTDLNYTTDKIGAFNAILPWATAKNGNKVILVDGHDENPMLVQPTNPPAGPIYAVAMDFTSEIEGAVTLSALENAARDYLDTHTPWLASETITADFVNNAEIEEQAAEIWLGDTVTVSWRAANITASMRVVGYEYDTLAESYLRMTLGQQQLEFVAVTGDIGYAGATSGGVSGADYITEVGTSGIWTWRKWSSGRAECVGKATYDLTLSTQWGSSGIYYNTGGAVSETLPNGLFTYADECFYNVSAVNASGGDSWPCIASGTPLSTSNTCGIYLLRIGQQNTQKTFSVSWRVVGRWSA